MIALKLSGVFLLFQLNGIVVQLADASGCVTDIWARNSRTCVKLTNAEVKCFGAGSYGRLGTGNENNVGDEPGEMGGAIIPVNFGTGRTMVKIALGSYHTCALLDDETTKCFGRNNLGQLGLGDTNNRGDQPDEMGDLLPAISLGTGVTYSLITGGAEFTCILVTSSGLPKCWGSNGKGQLGLGDSNNRGDAANEMGDQLPTVDIGSSVKAVAISAGGDHVCIISDTKTVKCWGRGDEGQLGLESTRTYGDESGEMGENLPVVSLGSGFTPSQIALGEVHTCVLSEEATVKCFGSGINGRLGSGSTSNIGDEACEMGDNLPVLPFNSGSATVNFIAVGEEHNCALFKTGVKCWGRNTDGRLGYDNPYPIGLQPNQISALADVDLRVLGTVSKIALGGTHTCAMNGAGEMACWGSATNGRLGSGDATNDIGDTAGDMEALPLVDVCPTPVPTEKPSTSPSESPTRSPSGTPTSVPTSKSPTKSPTKAPTFDPSEAPTTRGPTASPITSPKIPTRAPTTTPSFSPTKSCGGASKKTCNKLAYCKWKKVGEAKTCVPFDCTILTEKQCGKRKAGVCVWDPKKPGCIQVNVGRL